MASARRVRPIVYGTWLGINTLVANPQYAANMGFAISAQTVKDFLTAGYN